MWTVFLQDVGCIVGWGCVQLSGSWEIGHNIHVN